MAKAATTLHDVPDRPLERILECLMACPLALVRAAATCKRWRRIMTRSCFFARAIDLGPRPVHPRPIAGNYYNRASQIGGRNIVFVPVSPPAEHAVGSRKFSLEFLPGGSRPWEVVDSSCSLLLLAKKRNSGNAWTRQCFPEFVVCQPATQRYRLIPRMEEMKHRRCLFAYLDGTKRDTDFKLNPSDGLGICYGDLHVLHIMTTFKVVCVVYEGYDGVSDDVGYARACVFARNPKTRARRRIPGPHTWYAEESRRFWYNVDLHSTDSLHFLGKARGSLFWSINGDSRQFVSSGGMESLPDNSRGTVLRVIDGSAPGNILCVCLEGSCLKIFVFPEDHWELYKSIELMEATRRLVGYKEEYFASSLKVVMASLKFIVLAPSDQMWLFSIDLDTMHVVEHNRKPNYHFSSRDYPCELPWPPTLHACIGRCVREGQGPCSPTCIC